ncbi:MAG: hypothetical protein WCP15_00690 [bacterium]
MDIDIQKLEELLGAGKREEAGELIKAFVQKDLPENEKGAALSNFALVYLDLTNRINERYLGALKDAIDAMKAVNKSEKETEEKIKIDEVRESLKA